MRLVDWLKLIPEIPNMLKQIEDLMAANEALKVAAAAETANSAALKAKNDELLAALADARSNALSAEDKAALDAVLADTRAVTQALADSAAVNSPSN